jgi:hypothetical protein
LDIFLPKHQLAFEYQGEHHYFDIYLMGNLWQQQQRDKEKREVCQQKGITLIEIPYWWDKKTSSVIATIQQHRPDLIRDRIGGDPIPMQNPEEIPTGANLF